MADTDTRENALTDDDNNEATGHSTRIRFGVWLLVSVLFIGYLLLGQVEIRLWQSGRVLYVDRDIAHVWTYFGDRLPELPSPGLTTFIFWLSVGMMVATTVAGLWCFLVPRDADDPVSVDSRRIRTEASHD